MSAKPPETGGFLDRWSRRKRAVAAGIEAPEAEAKASLAEEAQALPKPEQAAQEAGPEAVAEPEEFVEPPALESIGADFDLSYWLRQKVPEAWKRQALRHAWSADPAIRDFKGLADYDLDYNTPGMAPGYGPLTESDSEIAAMARKIFGEPEPEDLARDSQPQPATADAADPQAGSDDAHAASQQDGKPSQGDVVAENAPTPGPAAQNAANFGKTDAASQQTEAELRENPQPIVRIRRRGGGAIPT